MHIQDFHSKLTSMKEEGHLFEALRSLSLIDDPRTVFDGSSIAGDWPAWPLMDAHNSCAASAEV